MRGLGWWFVLALPSTYTNAMVSDLSGPSADEGRSGIWSESWLWLSGPTLLATSTTCTCAHPEEFRAIAQEVYRNDKLNYYKFGLGLGNLTAAPAERDGKRVESGAAEAAAGGADQWVAPIDIIRA